MTRPGPAQALLKNDRYREGANQPEAQAKGDPEHGEAARNDPTSGRAAGVAAGFSLLKPAARMLSGASSTPPGASSENFAHALGQNPKRPVQFHALVDAGDFAGRGAATGAVAASLTPSD